MTRREKREARLTLLASVTALEALLLSAASYERPATCPGGKAAEALDALCARGLAERDPTAERVYRSTERGEAVRDALRFELGVASLVLEYRPEPPVQARPGKVTRRGVEKLVGVLDRLPGMKSIDTNADIAARIGASTDRAMRQRR